MVSKKTHKVILRKKSHQVSQWIILLIAIIVIIALVLVILNQYDIVRTGPPFTNQPFTLGKNNLPGPSDSTNNNICGNGICNAGETDISCPADCHATRMFVTNEVYNASLGGLEGADSICQFSAQQAGINGAWKAWLSSRAQNASERLSHNPSSYRRTDGKIIATNWNDLTDGTLENAINVTEYGQEIPGWGAVWTATDPQGNGPPGFEGTCDDWTSDRDTGWGYLGLFWTTSQYWTGMFTSSNKCWMTAHLYCLEQLPSTGFCGDGACVAGETDVTCPADCHALRMFVTSNKYSGNLSGLTGADRICQISAGMAGLGGIWKAWLSTSTESASSRVMHNPAAYYRTDGERIASNWDDLTDGTIEHELVMTEFGTPYSGGDAEGYPERTSVWTATDIHGNKPAPPVSPIYTCNDWTSNSDTDHGYVGVTFSTSQYWTGNFQSSYPCFLRLPIYCIEQPLPAVKRVTSFPEELNPPAHAE